jgi:protein gp37
LVQLFVYPVTPEFVRPTFVYQITFYMYQMATLYLLSAITITITGCLLLSQMTKVFGVNDIKEKQIIRRTMYIYIVAFIVRLISFILVIGDVDTVNTRGF